MGRNSKFEFTMKTFIAFAVLAVVFVAVNAETYDWGVPCTTHNDCAFSKHNLYCRAVGGANVTASRCVQCMTEHDCQKGEFCVSAKGVVVDGDEVFIGQCAAKESPLGKRCTPGVTSANGNRKCYSFETSGRGGFWGIWRAGGMESSVMGVNQNFLSQALLTIAFFGAATFVLVLASSCGYIAKSKME